MNILNAGLKMAILTEELVKLCDNSMRCQEGSIFRPEELSHMNVICVFFYIYYIYIDIYRVINSFVIFNHDAHITYFNI